MDQEVSVKQGHNAENEIIPTKPETPKATPGLDVPNGGIVAWAQVTGSFFLFFNGW